MVLAHWNGFYFGAFATLCRGPTDGADRVACARNFAVVDCAIGTGTFGWMIYRPGVDPDLGTVDAIETNPILAIETVTRTI
jgi:hypothetical protein